VKNAHLKINFLKYITGPEDVSISYLLTRKVNQYLLRLVNITPLTCPHLNISGKKIPVAHTRKHFLWKCLCIHQIKCENEEQKVKLA